MMKRGLKQIFIVLTIAIIVFMNHEMNGKLPCYKAYNRNEILKLAAMQCEACDEWIQKAFAQYAKVKKQGDDAIDKYDFDFYGYNKDDYDLITDPKLIQFFEQSAREIGLDRAPRVYVEKSESQVVTKKSANAMAGFGIIFISLELFRSLQHKRFLYGDDRATLLHEMSHIKHGHGVCCSGLSKCRKFFSFKLKREFDCMELVLEDELLMLDNYYAKHALYAKLEAFRKHVMENPCIKFGKQEQFIEDTVASYKSFIDQGKLPSHSIVGQKDIDDMLSKGYKNWSMLSLWKDENQADFEAYTHLNCYKCAQDVVINRGHRFISRVDYYANGYWHIDSVKMLVAGLKQKGLLCQYHQDKH